MLVKGVKQSVGTLDNKAQDFVSKFLILKLVQVITHFW